MWPPSLLVAQVTMLCCCSGNTLEAWSTEPLRIMITMGCIHTTGGLHSCVAGITFSCSQEALGRCCTCRPRRASGGSTKRSRSRLREPGTPSATPRSAGVKKQAAPFVGEAAGEGSTPAVPNPAFVPTRQAAAHAMAAIRAQSQAQAATHGMGVPLDDPEGLRGAFPEGEADAFHGGEGVGAGVGGSAAETAIILHPTAVQNVLSLPSAHQRSARGRYSRALVASSRGRSGSGSLQLVDHRRRIRRPFTVQEVAILVDAVETLGSKELEVAPLTSAWYAHGGHLFPCNPRAASCCPAS